jgi:pentapeptide MXKDX repeat protein
LVSTIVRYFVSRHLLDRDHSRSPSHPCDQVCFRPRNKRRPLSNLWKVTSVAEPKNAFRGDCYVMIKRTALILSAATLSFGLALASTALADDAMKKDTMSKDAMSNDSMKKDSMSKDSMSKDAMSKDAMSKDTMSKDTMSKDSMKNDEMKKN